MGTVQKSYMFHGLQFTVDFAASSTLSFKEKQEIRRDIVDNGGILSYILTKQTSYLVTCNGERTLSSYKGRTAFKYGIAVVSFEFVKECIKSGKLLDPQPYLLSETQESQNFSSGKISGKSCQASKKQTNIVMKPQLPDINKIRVWLYKSADCPCFNEHSCEITKDVVLQGLDSSGNVATFYALELHVIPLQVPCSGSRYRLFTHHGNLKSLKEGNPGTKECRYFSTAGEAVGGYTALYNQLTQPAFSLTRVDSILSHKIGSDKMMQMTVSDYCSEEDSQLSSDVANLVDFIWNETTGNLSNILAVPVDAIKLEDVEKAEAILLLLKKALDAAEDSSTVKNLSDEFFSVIPHKDKGIGIVSKQVIAQKQDLCQLIKDMVSVGESTNWMTRRSMYVKFRSLKCHIECLERGSDEFKKIEENVHLSETSPSKINVLNVFSIHRPVEEGTFSHDIENKKLLFHSSKVTNFVGILSRGLLLPKIVVDDFGGKRSDAGMLGSGIYFASSASTSAKYSAPGSSGTRLMLINEVALGKVKVFKKFSLDLTSPPAGFDSCHGVQSTGDEPSDFKDDEYVIYNANQQKIRYLVEFVLPGDNILPRDDVSLDSGFSDEDIEVVTEGSTVDLSDVMSVVDPLTKVEPGLKGTGEKPIPLQSVHIRAKLLDLAAQVIVFQAYKNTSATPIEAKYVFPLDDMAAVCGFEAFINGKHIVGEVKEKEQAHKEYREAISQGHGAYLMDEETPDVFTVSVGNLPPGAHVLIKITYVSELLVDREHICFTLPGSVAPWKRNKALEEITQTDVDTVRIEEEGPSDLMHFSVQVSVEMPFDIRSIDSPSHSIRTKRTASKAVVLLEPGQSLGSGFQLLIGLAEIHVPRMWVERHGSKPDSQACMLTFYPEFEAESPQQVEILFLLDLSCSMKGSSVEEAKKILLMCLSHMKKDWIFNILVFGSKHSELFPCSMRIDTEAHKEAEEFIKSLTATKGSTELWRVLQKLYLLPAVSAADHPRNLFLISDGHVTEEDTTLHLIRTNYQTDRLFTFGVGSTANRYLLQAMSKVGAGASEFFDSKAKSKWEKKVKWQLSKAEQPGLTSVAVTWQQHDSGSSSPVQAPHQVLSLFNGSRQVVYGFVDNCTQATLTAEVNGKTVSTMVSTADLNITTGNILHQLTAKAIIRDWDEGSLHEQRTAHEIVKRDRKDYIISISKEFSVVSKFTSFVAVEHREKDEKFEEGQGPSIYDLVAAEEVDKLSYIGWEQRPETEKKREPSIEEKLEKKLEEAKVLETCAVLQCERLYHDVMKEARDELGPDHALTVKMPKVHFTVHRQLHGCLRSTVLALSNLYCSLMGDREKAHQILEENNLGDLSNVFSSLKSDEWGSKFDIEEEYDMVECMEGGEETSSTEDFISIEDYEGWEEEVEEEKKVINSVRTPFRRLGMGRRWSGSLDEEEEKPQQQWQHQQQKEKDEGDKMTFKRAQEPHHADSDDDLDREEDYYYELSDKGLAGIPTSAITGELSVGVEQQQSDLSGDDDKICLVRICNDAASEEYTCPGPMTYADSDGDLDGEEDYYYELSDKGLAGIPTSAITGELSVDMEQQQSDLSGDDDNICLVRICNEAASEEYTCPGPMTYADSDDDLDREEDYYYELSDKGLAGIPTSAITGELSVDMEQHQSDLSGDDDKICLVRICNEAASKEYTCPGPMKYADSDGDLDGEEDYYYELSDKCLAGIPTSAITGELSVDMEQQQSDLSGDDDKIWLEGISNEGESEELELLDYGTVGSPFKLKSFMESMQDSQTTLEEVAGATPPRLGSFSGTFGGAPPLPPRPPRPPPPPPPPSSASASPPVLGGAAPFLKAGGEEMKTHVYKSSRKAGAARPEFRPFSSVLNSTPPGGFSFGSSSTAIPLLPHGGFLSEQSIQAASTGVPFGQPTLTQGFGALANQPPQVAANTGLFGSAHSLSKKGDLFDSSLPPAFPPPPPPVQSATPHVAGFSGTLFGSTVMPQSFSSPARNAKALSTDVSEIRYEKLPQRSLLGSAVSSSGKREVFGVLPPPPPPPPPPPAQSAAVVPSAIIGGAAPVIEAERERETQEAAKTGLFGSVHSLRKKGDLFGSSLSSAFPPPCRRVKSAIPEAVGPTGTLFGSTVMPQSALSKARKFLSTDVTGIRSDKPPQPGLLGSVLSPSGNKEVSGVSPLPPPPPPPPPPPLPSAQAAEVAPPTIVGGAAPVFKRGGGGEIKTHLLKSIPPAPAKKVSVFAQLKASMAEKIETFCKKGKPHVSEKYDIVPSSFPSVIEKKIEYLGASSKLKDTRASSVPLQPIPYPRRRAPPVPPAETGISPPCSPPADTPVVDDSGLIRHLNQRQALLHSVRPKASRRRGREVSSSDVIPTLEQKKGAEKTTKPKPFFSVSSRRQKLKEIFAKQTSVGFWNADALIVIGITKKDFVDFLVKAGAKSLGPRVFEEVQSLLATLLMLAFVKFRLSVEVPLTLPLGNIFEVSVGDLGEPYSKDVTRALKWIKMQEQKMPLLYARLEFGANWEAATEKIVEEMRV